MGNHVRYLTGALGKQTRPKIIELRQLTVVQQDPLLSDITLEIFEGEAVALLGSSEAEKKTLLACLLGKIQPTRGEIRVLNTTLPPLPPQIRRQVGIMALSTQHALDERVGLRIQRRATHYGTPFTPAQIDAYCGHYGLASDMSVATLTRLQARVLALALALVHDPRLLLLVEPLTGLSEQEQGVMRGYLQRAQREGRTLLSTFSPPLAEKELTGYDLVARLEQGRLLRVKS